MLTVKQYTPPETIPIDTIPPERIPLTWSPKIASDCSSMAVPESQGWFDSPIGNECLPFNRNQSKWIWWSTNENSQFVGVGTGEGKCDISPNDPVWIREFTKKSDGRYQVVIELDKVTADCIVPCRNTYSFVSLGDNWDINHNLPRPNLSENLSIELDLGILEAEQVNDSNPNIGLAKNRVMVGSMARWGGENHFLEINLYRTNNFDLYTMDSENLIDRYVSIPGVEIFYYYRPMLSHITGIENDLPTLSVNQTATHIEVPLAQLFKSSEWSPKPENWRDAEIAGIYIGMEIWGRGRVRIVFDDYQLYKTN